MLLDMRYLFLAIIGIALSGCASTPNESVNSVEIEEIKLRYIPEENFKRISEYWSGAENQGNRIILRTDPEVRDGFMWLSDDPGWGIELDEDVIGRLEVKE